MRRSLSSSKKTVGKPAAKRAAAPAAKPSAKSRKLEATSDSKQLVYEMSRSFFELLLKHRNHYIQAVSDEKLAAMQGHVMNYVAEHPCTMRELAESAFLEPSNLTGIVDKLEARGLVTRREAEGDRRSKLVYLTEAGVALRKRLFVRFSEPAPWMLVLTLQDQKRLLEIVRKAIDYEKSLEPPSSATPRAREAAVRAARKTKLRRS